MVFIEVMSLIFIQCYFRPESLYFVMQSFGEMLNPNIKYLSDICSHDVAFYTSEEKNKRISCCHCFDESPVTCKTA